MNILLVSAMAENKNGGLGIWTKSFIKYCNQMSIRYQFVNMDMVGDRKENLTAKRNICDEIVRTNRIFGSLKSSIEKEEYDVAHINTACGPFGIIRDWIIAKKINRRGIPIIIQYHCNVRDCVCSELSVFFLKKLVNLAKKNLVLNSDSKEFVQKYSKKSVDILPNFIDISYVKSRKPINKHVSKIFYDGRIETKKGAKEIFETARLCPEKKFILAGSMSDEAEKWNKPDNLYLMGVIEEKQIFDCLDDADVFLFPSYTEGFSISLLESMARGVPSIVTNVGANKDMIENKGGIIVNTGDVEGIVSAITQMEDYTTRNVMSKWLINKTQNTYTSSIVFEQLMMYYRNVGKVDKL